MTDRWPPVYDKEELRRAIQDLHRDWTSLVKSFYHSDRREPQPFCQGDVIDLSAPFVYLDGGGEPAAEVNDADCWLISANSCDLARTLEDVRWIQLVPAYEIEPNEPELPELSRYAYSRRFFLPDGLHGPGRPLVAEFTQAVSVDRRALSEHAQVVCRLSQKGWFLLHCCLVRFLARADGRYD